MLNEKERELLSRCTDVYGRQEENEIILEKDLLLAIFAREELSRHEATEPEIGPNVNYLVPSNLMFLIYLALLDMKKKAEPRIFDYLSLLLEIEDRFPIMKKKRLHCEALDFAGS